MQTAGPVDQTDTNKTEEHLVTKRSAGVAPEVNLWNPSSVGQYLVRIRLSKRRALSLQFFSVLPNFPCDSIYGDCLYLDCLCDVSEQGL